MSQTTTSATASASAGPLSPGMIVSVIQDVCRRWTLVAAAAILAGILAFVYTDYTWRPQYSTGATFVVTAGSTSSTTYQNLTATTNTAAVFTEVLNSSLLRQKVLEAAGITAFDGTISASAISETNLLTMTVTGSDPRTVFLVSRAIIDNHHVVSSEVLGSTILEVLREPAVPTAPTNTPDTSRLVMQAAVLAAAAAVCALALLSYMADRVRSREEADAKLGCRVLGQLYHERKHKTMRDLLDRRKKNILISDPLTSFVYTESIHKLSSRVDKCRHRGEHIIMVTSLLENEGKSTVAANLAISMAKKGKKVLLIDCDLRKPACGLILGGADGAPGVADVLQGKIPFQEGVQYLEHYGLSLMAGRRSLRTATSLVNSVSMDALLLDASDAYDLVIVDTPPMSVAPDAERISEFVDAAILVVRQNAANASDLNEAVSILERSHAHLLGCVLNNVYGAGGFLPAFGYGSYGKYGKYGRYGYGKYGYGHREETVSEDRKA